MIPLTTLGVYVFTTHGAYLHHSIARIVKSDYGHQCGGDASFNYAKEIRLIDKSGMRAATWT